MAAPILWQLEISHFNEKVRWALDYKGVEHERRSLMPGWHRVKARRLTGVPTTPVLQIGDEAIGDSTAILEAVEERWPDPALYPQDPDERARAVALEDYFDAEIAPHFRRAAYHTLLPDAVAMRKIFGHGRGPLARGALRVGFPFLRTGMRRTFEITDERSAESRDRLRAAVGRLEAEIGPSGYLVGDSFTVADLTAAALLYGAVQPPEYPYKLFEGVELPASAQALMAELGDRPAGEWVREMYARHRDAPAAIATPA